MTELSRELISNYLRFFFLSIHDFLCLDEGYTFFLFINYCSMYIITCVFLFICFMCSSSQQILYFANQIRFRYE